MIQRVPTKNGNQLIIGYHTQEFWEDHQPLTAPIKCISPTAWLGIGYYFWTDLEFAHYWGQDSKKKRTGYYDVYWAHIEEENLLNACFSEEGYSLFKESIDEVIQHFRNHGLSITLDEVSRYLADNYWPNMGVTGIIYDDLPQKVASPGRTYSVIPPLYYKKRIQIVVFSVKNIVNFGLEVEHQQ
jgi:hypothetical protein